MKVSNDLYYPFEEKTFHDSIPTVGPIFFSFKISRGKKWFNKGSDEVYYEKLLCKIADVLFRLHKEI